MLESSNVRAGPESGCPPFPDPQAEPGVAYSQSVYHMIATGGVAYGIVRVQSGSLGWAAMLPDLVGLVGLTARGNSKSEAQKARGGHLESVTWRRVFVRNRLLRRAASLVRHK